MHTRIHPNPGCVVLQTLIFPGVAESADPNQVKREDHGCSNAALCAEFGETSPSAKWSGYSEHPAIWQNLDALFVFLVCGIK